MRKGGYQILDFANKSITAGGETYTTIKGAFNKIAKARKKAVLLSGLVIDTTPYHDTIVDAVLGDNGYTFTAFGYDITVSSVDRVSAVVHQGGGGLDIPTFDCDGFDITSTPTENEGLVSFLADNENNLVCLKNVKITSNSFGAILIYLGGISAEYDTIDGYLSSYESIAGAQAIWISADTSADTIQISEV